MLQRIPLFYAIIQKQAVFEVYANKIQKSYRAHQARKEAKELKRLRMEALAYAARMYVPPRLDDGVEG